MKKKINVCLLIALILGVLYLLYSAYYWGGANAGSSTSSEQAGAALATVMVMPSLVIVLIAVIFNALGLFMRKAAFALVAGILYAVGMVLFIPYFMFVIVEMILSFVAYAQMKKDK
ncbi:MAG: hypothetical protein ACOYJL_06755 [Tractidigestivibacter sp.]|jgi:predicted permease|uniref:hypothetical protein n=1 Tax=Tractidigestivibacter sp. TaxID=2847320 RepID=UPI003D89C428